MLLELDLFARALSILLVAVAIQAVVGALLLLGIFFIDKDE